MHRLATLDQIPPPPGVTEDSNRGGNAELRRHGPLRLTAAKVAPDVF